MANTRKMKQYIKSEQVCTTRNNGRLYFKNVSWAIGKRARPIWKLKAHKKINILLMDKSTWLIKA